VGSELLPDRSRPHTTPPSFHHVLDSMDELIQLTWLHHVLHRPSGKGPLMIVRAFGTAENHDGRGSFTAQISKNRMSVSLGKIQIENNQIEPLRPKVPQRLFSVVGDR
jgi:hypothetical protein